MKMLTLPFDDPVLIFAILLFVILFAPILLRRLRIPGIIGLILAGVLIGPHGFNLLLRDSSIQLFGTVGLLYIMFLAGLEVDLNDFRANRRKSIVFGLLTFSLPLSLGALAGIFILDFPFASALLLASMFASHTLLSYPIVSRLGIKRAESVNISIGGTIITDTAALLVLALVTGSRQGNIGVFFWVRLVLGALLLGALVIYLFPIIGKWFFKTVQDNVSQYIFCLGMLYLAALLAEMSGLEPIIGAFLAGLGLNRLIPHTSPLMNRIEFIGNALFIPFFLIGVGMLVDYRAFLKGGDALIVAAVMVIVSFLGKWLAAFAMQKLYGYQSVERNLIFGLTTSHAAAALAAILVGYNLGILNENVLNGTILMILISCIVSSVVTENAGRKLAVEGGREAQQSSHVDQRILVPIAHPRTIEGLMSLALMLKDRQSTDPLYALTVVQESQEIEARIAADKRMLEQAIHYASAADQRVQILSRVDLNIANGILRAIKEVLITDVVIGWNAERSGLRRIFGSILDQLTAHTHQMLLVSRLVQPLNTVQRLLVLVPPNADIEPGFARWVRALANIATQAGATMEVYAPERVSRKMEALRARSGSSATITYFPVSDLKGYEVLRPRLKKDDLFILVSSRKGGPSYDRELDRIPSRLSLLPGQSFIILYPEQVPEQMAESSDLGGDSLARSLEGGVSSLLQIGRIIGRTFQK